VQVKQSKYENAIFTDTIPALIKRLSSYRFTKDIPKQKKKVYPFENRPLSHQRFWPQVISFLERNSIVLAEAGTSMFGTQQMYLPDDSTYIAQVLWGSIGYTVGALLGASIAAPHRPSVLFVGDGSFQLTAQEISTIIRHQLNPTIFLVDNNGYTIERRIHGPTMPYNDIQHWNYSDFPKVFGDNTWCITVKTEEELENAWIERKKNPKKMAFITVVMDQMDAPEILIKIGKAMEQANKIPGF
jgi:TPP-dependent 2-oxoacid decarboxylase